MRYVFAAVSLLLLASGCEAAKTPRAQQQASNSRSEDSVADAEADYVSAKHRYLAALAADKDRGTPDSVLRTREAVALGDLADRLRRILGPFKGKGFADSGTINVTSLRPPDTDFNSLDGMTYRSSDSITVPSRPTGPTALQASLPLTSRIRSSNMPTRCFAGATPSTHRQIRALRCWWSRLLP